MFACYYLFYNGQVMPAGVIMAKELRSSTAIVEEMSDKLFGLPGLFNVGATPNMQFDPVTNKITGRTIIWRRPGLDYPGRPGQEKTDELEAFLRKEVPKAGDPEGFVKISRVDVLGETRSVRILAPGEPVPEDLRYMHSSAIAIDSNDALALEQRLDALAQAMPAQAKTDRASQVRKDGPAQKG
jgi:hypothetical protein